MRKIVLLFLGIVMFDSCGILIDTEEETFTYTYILKNETGVSIEITGDLDRRTETIENGNSFECFFEASNSYVGGLCGQFIEIKIPNTNNGYRCHGGASDIEGLCFVEDSRLFTISDGTVFTEIDTRVYEYVLTPDLLENVFELPE